MKSGIIPVYKPEGISSAAVVARVKKALGAQKAGHTGTLDPFATGLLLCAVNQGTRISGFFLNGQKRYTARLHLGIETDTHDRTGKIESTAPESVMSALLPETIQSVIQAFEGVQDQVPPSFSALKHKGQPLYKLARQGVKITKTPRRIEIFNLQIHRICLPFVDIDVQCSAGTYIRSLAFDIGRTLGCGAHLAELCRTGSSQFTLDTAIELDALEKMDRNEIESAMVSLSTCLAFMPKARPAAAVIQKIKFGQKLTVADIECSGIPAGTPFRVVDHDDRLWAVIHLNDTLQGYNYHCVFVH